MIVFDLKCAEGHVFEAWFRSSEDFAGQVAAGAVHCPDCGDTGLTKAISAPRINGTASGRRDDAPTPCGLPACASGRCAFDD